MFKDKIILILLFVFFLCISSKLLYSQEGGEVFILSQKVGETIDADERKLYNLYPSINGFESATVFKLSDGSFMIKISSHDENTNEKKIRMDIRLESDIIKIKKYIDEFDTSNIGSDKVDSKNETTRSITDDIIDPLGVYLGRKYCMQIFVGSSRLKGVSDWYELNLNNKKLPQISMSTYGFRLGRRYFPKMGISTLLEISFSTSEGNLSMNYPDPNFVEPFEITHKIKNTMFGFAMGTSIPLYTNIHSQSFFLSPKAIILDFKWGMDIMLIKSNNGITSYNCRLKSGGFQTGVVPDEIIESGGRLLFSVDIGANYLINKYLIFKFDYQIGIYPVSGPGTIEGEPTGPPDTWGSESLLLFGIEFLL